MLALQNETCQIQLNLDWMSSFDGNQEIRS
jgi:hypothetical protein